MEIYMLAILIYAVNITVGYLLDKYLRIPWMITAVLLGMTLSSFGLFSDVIRSTEFQVLSKMGLLFFLFTIGIEIEVEQLRKLGHYITVGFVLLTLTEGLLLAMFFYFAHPGGVADVRFIKTQPVAPSSIQMKSGAVTPRALTREEIEELVDKFGKAALRAKKAGFDMVEIQAGHGLLINQFLSPLYNKRKDEFGGSLDGRVRFLEMIVEKIRDYAGKSFPISVRLGVEEFEEGGIKIEEGRQIAKKLSDAGVDAIHVTLGGTSMEKRLEPMPYPQGWRVYLAEEIKKVVDVPVIAVGVIREPWFAEKILQEGKADFIALGRALIADPQWPKKALMGEEKAIRRCVSCNECVRARHFEDLPIRCSFNPTIGVGKELATIKRAKHRKKVMIVGAGPAGMEAARVAALRGHDVYIFDKEDQIGGTLNIAAVVPGKDKLRWIVEYYAYTLPKLGVHIQLGEFVDKQKKSKPSVQTS
jgi:2,4-dienoyl-CoA reductase-like NADH-dependent reductase (Old Yellow Enzyme family)